MTMRIVNTKPHGYTGLEKVKINGSISNEKSTSINIRKFQMYNSLSYREDKCGNKTMKYETMKTMKFVNSFEDLVFAAFSESDKTFKKENNLGVCKRKNRLILDFDEAFIENLDLNNEIKERSDMHKKVQSKSFVIENSLQRTQNSYSELSPSFENLKTTLTDVKSSGDSFFNETDSCVNAKVDLNLNKKPKAGILYETSSKKSKTKKKVTIIENFYEKCYNPLSSSKFLNELKSHPIIKCNYYLNDYFEKHF